MTVTVLPIPSEGYERALALQPRATVYHSPAYIAANANVFDGATMLALLVEQGGCRLLNVVARRSIPSMPDFYDLETPYGYGGVLATGGNFQELADAWKVLGDWCANSWIVAEFLRFDPLGDTKVVEAYGAAHFDRRTVSVVIDQGGGASGSVASSHVRNVRKAVSCGLVARWSKREADWASFRRLYETNMARLGADPFYFFPESYFIELAQMPCNRSGLVLVEDGHGTPVASAVVFFDDHVAHYHLGASDEFALPKRPMNLLFDAIFTEAQSRGLTRVHLGGGRTSRADDSLLRFKRTLGRDSHAYCVGGRVFLVREYAELARRWMVSSGEPPSRRILFYRDRPGLAV